MLAAIGSNGSGDDDNLVITVLLGDVSGGNYRNALFPHIR
jgi:hypothetical protein